jgi:hypothetical protein
LFRAVIYSFPKPGITARVWPLIDLIFDSG